MRKWMIMYMMGMLLVQGNVWANEVKGVEIVEKLSAGDAQLTLNGTGIRSKLFFDLYIGALYLQAPSDDGAEVVQADEPMALRLHILSKLITSEKMEEATREGFEQATGGNTSGIQDRMERFISVFGKEEIGKGDVFELVYLPGQGVLTRKNNESMMTVPGLDFKQALFAIWLSEDPVQKSLKEGMLGK